MLLLTPFSSLVRHLKGRVLVALADGTLAIFHRGVGKMSRCQSHVPLVNGDGLNEGSHVVCHSSLLLHPGQHILPLNLHIEGGKVSNPAPQLTSGHQYISPSQIAWGWKGNYWGCIICTRLNLHLSSVATLMALQCWSGFICPSHHLHYQLMFLPRITSPGTWGESSWSPEGRYV